MRSMFRRRPARKISGNQRTITGRQRPRAGSARRAGRGVDASIAVYPVPTHDFHVFWSFLPEARDAIDQLGRFVRAVASPPGESAAPQPG
jgi:acetyl esterase/lipase